ncbi:MAG: cupin domain-containing protein [Clostridiales bacterium]|nr:cupin domain-containing protein [Clostridiales bacterium]
MSDNVKTGAEFVKHPTQEGVFMKHFYGKDDTDGRLSNVEIHIVPGFQISSHKHDDSSEFFYVVSGTGEYMDNGKKTPIKSGDAFKAPAGVVHAIKNIGDETLRLFSTFSPPAR